MLHAPVDHLDHLRLDVLRVDDAVRADPARQPHREPAAARAEIGHDGAISDPERVHDLFGLIPVVAIGCFERPEVLRREQPFSGHQSQSERYVRTGRLNGPSRPTATAQRPGEVSCLSTFHSPTIPPRVIASTDKSRQAALRRAMSSCSRTDSWAGSPRARSPGPTGGRTTASLAWPPRGASPRP